MTRIMSVPVVARVTEADLRRRVALDEFKEENVKRDKGGKFSSTGGGGGTPEKPEKKDKPKAASLASHETLKDIVRDPDAAALAAKHVAVPTREEAETVLREHYGYSDEEIAQLRGEKGGKAERSPGAASLYKAPTKTGAQMLDAHPGAGEAAKRVEARLKTVVNTDASPDKGGFKNADGTYVAERVRLHHEIITEILSAEAIHRATPAPGEKPVLTLLGGRGGSGKGWLTNKGKGGPVDPGKAVLLDADEVKAMLGDRRKGREPPYDKWNAAQFHEESSDVLEKIDAVAASLGINIIHDATMKSKATVGKRMDHYESNGYEAEGYYMYASPETAANRALKRFSRVSETGEPFSGRYVPPDIILGNTNNEKNFDKASERMRKWQVYDGDVEGQPPKLHSSSH